MFDVVHGDHTAGARLAQTPFFIDGMHVTPPLTASSQLTGDDDTVLRWRHTGGRVKLEGYCRDLIGNEGDLVITDGEAYLTSGQAVWATLVCYQKRPDAGIALKWVIGTVAAVASAVVPTEDEIAAALGDYSQFAILGDARWYRSADLVISMQVSEERRPAYVDTDAKEAHVFDQADQTTLGFRYHSTLQFPLDLSVVSGLGDGVMVVDNASLPNLPWGGFLGTPEAACVQTGTDGAFNDADVHLQLGISGTPCTGGLIEIAIADVVVGDIIAGSAISAGADFKQGAGLDIEQDAKTGHAYTAGKVIVRIPVYEYVQL